MSVLATVFGAFFLLTALPATPLSWLTQYTMSADVEQVAGRIPFPDEGRSVFEATQPELLTGAALGQACDRTPEGTAGCFAGGLIGAPGHIVIFEPADERLKDQVAVTVVHEFLHAAYHQLTASERDQVDVLLAARWAQLPVDNPLRSSFKNSVQGDERSVGTEQFAYLGSSIPDVGPELEAFYAPYFTDRQAAVGFAVADAAMWDGLDAAYEAASTSATSADQVALDAAAQLAADRAQLDADWARLDVDRQLYNQQADQYNALSPLARSQSSVSTNGGRPERWGDYLARTLASFDTRDADLAARALALPEAEAEVATRQSEAAAARTEAERLYADYNELLAAMTPR